jgi:hypothetical protein
VSDDSSSDDSSGGALCRRKGGAIYADHDFQRLEAEYISAFVA